MNTKNFMKGIDILRSKDYSFSLDQEHKLFENAEEITPEKWLKICESMGTVPSFVSDYDIVGNIISMMK